VVDIISKRDGPRREDLAARDTIRRNRGTIDRLMNQLTGGGLKARAQAEAAATPVAAGLIIHHGKATDPGETVRPYLRISVNGRVVVVDEATSRQLHFLGEIRGRGDARRFVLATRANGFFACLEDELQPLLAELDGAALADEEAEAALAAAIRTRLGLATTDQASLD
jgi:hypothetical protein